MNKKWFVLIGVVVLVVTMLVGCAQPAPSPAPTPSPSTTPAPAPEKITLKFSTWMPAGKNHPDYAKAERMFAEITKRTNGQVEFEMYPSEQLAGQKEQIDGIKTGLFDIATHMASTVPGKTPLWTINWQPLAPTGDVAVMMDVMRNLSKLPAMQKELDDWNAMFFGTCGGGPRILMSKKEIKSFDDFKGLKIRASGREGQAYQMFGATPVAVPTAEVYDALQKGTIDATTQPYINLVSYGINEVTKYVYLANLGMGSPIFVMSKSTYNKLPANVQKVIMDVALEDDAIHGKLTNEAIATALAKGKQDGKQTFIDCPTAEQQKYNNLVMDKIMGDWVKEMTDKGLPGKEVLDAYMETN